jgi:hypothetical protein
MSIEVELLTPSQEACYENLIQAVEYSLLYSSLKYRNFLKRILGNSQDLYLVAYESGRMVGAIPSFVKYNSNYGNILNSLPFYGSNGGMIVSPKAIDSKAVKQSLLDAFHSLAVENSVISSTLISNPLNADIEFYETYSRYTLQDERIGQVISLPNRWSTEIELQNALMGMFHQKTRNAVRKAQKSQLIVRHSNSLEALQSLASLHQQNMIAVGGLPKPWSVFMSIREIFTYDQDYRVYLAEKDGIIIAALLIFFYHRTAEYYTPATCTDFRIYQPMSLLVYEAMQEAARRGCKYWNWGGTWLTQSGVYLFKSRWGTQDLPYYYYICEYQKSGHLRQLTAKEIANEYLYFYVLPFKILK